MLYIYFKANHQQHDDVLLKLLLSAASVKYRIIIYLKVLEKCTKNLIGHSRLAFNNHESNIDC